MDLMAWCIAGLVAHGMERPSAALLTLLGLFSGVLLVGIAAVAAKERQGAHRACQPRRGATRHKPGQP